MQRFRVIPRLWIQYYFILEILIKNNFKIYKVPIVLAISLIKFAGESARLRFELDPQKSRKLFSLSLDNKCSSKLENTL